MTGRHVSDTIPGMTSTAPSTTPCAPADVLDFWFDGARSRPEWFRKDEAFDEVIRVRFGATLEAALAGALGAGWQGTPEAVLAQVIVLDQFTRNAHRGTPRAFEGDRRALALATAMVDRGDDLRLAPAVRRQFVYLPFEHAEDLQAQRRSLHLFQALAAQDAQLASLPDWAQRHLEIIERFGRFPHRNLVLGRVSTAEELAFLQQPGSSF